MSEELPFEPFPFLNDPHQQTFFNSFFNFLFEPPSDQKLVRLPDGDQISLEITTPREWKKEDPTVILVHGLCGSHKSPNLVRMARRLEPLGVRAVRFNMRGCGSGRGLARQIYHSGRSEDLFEAVKALKLEHPASPIVLIGFSPGPRIESERKGRHRCRRLPPRQVRRRLDPAPLDPTLRDRLRSLHHPLSPPPHRLHDCILDPLRPLTQQRAGSREIRIICGRIKI